MYLRIIGALTLCVGSSVFGFSAAGAIKRSIKTLRQLIVSLEIMRCEVSYTLTPIAKICQIISKSCRGEVALFYEKLMGIYSGNYPEQDNWASTLLQDTLRNIPQDALDAMTELISSFGKFGVTEQLRMIDLTAEKLNASLDKINSEKMQRCKCYETLGICTGLAIAVLIV